MTICELSLGNRGITSLPAVVVLTTTRAVTSGVVSMRPRLAPPMASACLHRQSRWELPDGAVSKLPIIPMEL